MLPDFGWSVVRGRRTVRQAQRRPAEEGVG